MANVVVFDMGGVLYDFQGDRLIASASRRSRRWRSEEVQEIWVPLVHRFETGACSEAEFASEVVSSYDLTSHLSGFHKPDRRAFEAISAAHDPGTRFFFLDDRTLNVSAATGVGWHARRARGVAEARRACVELGLL